MYADRYAQSRGLNPGALALALGGSVFFLFGLSLTAPNLVKSIDKVLRVTSIDAPTPPPPKPLDPQPKPHEKTIDSPRPDPVEVTRPLVEATPGGYTAPKVDVAPNPGTVVGLGSGDVAQPPVHIPVLFGPELDNRYADAFQPAYPAGERTAEREGRVVVRVLIGTDGRVKAVEQVSAASPAFFEATRRQALTRWRFRPGTRDGVPVEAWRTMGVRFQLDTD